ncbi:LysR family transcriptional regulator [Vibrio paucivorans]
MKSQLDLNLLIVLILLDKHRQLKPVAKVLGKTESAVSKHLSKLREQLGDPLFVRGAHEFEPTDFTLELLPKISSGLEMINTAVVQDEFDPKTYQKDIVIALPSLGQYLVGDTLLMDLMETFPNAVVKITTWSHSSVGDILANDVDVGVQYFNEEQTKAVYQHHIGKFRPAIVVSDQCEETSFDELLKMPFVLMEMKGWVDNKPIAKRLLESKGLKINKRAVVDNITCLLKVIREINGATLLPQIDKPFDGYRCVELPAELDFDELPVVVANYKLANRDNPLHRLLIKKIKQHIF